MKLSRILLLTVLVSLLATGASAETRGWGIGLGILDGDFGFQGRKDFWLGGDISQITAQASVHFPNTTTFRLDTDYHFIINPESPSRFYPLVGLQLAFNSDAVKFGVNAGGGVNFKLTAKTAAFAEIKYIFSDWNAFSLMAGIYF